MSSNLISAPTSRISGGRPGDSASADGGAATVFLMLLLAGASLFLLGGGDLNQRILLCLCIGMTLLTTLSLAPNIGVVLTLIYAAVMGGIKRWLIPVWGYETNDPFMLILPAVSGLLVAQLIFKRQIPTDTLLSRLVLALLIIFGLEIFNPLQGGPVVGLAGALFWIPPLLWFFIGRNVGSMNLLRTLITMAMVIGVLCGLYGTYQQFFGLLDSEKLWVHYTGWQLGVGSTQKVFSTFCSTAEYAQFLELGAVLGFIGALKRRIIPIVLCIGCFIMLIFSGNRGPIFYSLAVFALIWAIQGKTTKIWLPRMGLAVVLAAIAIFVGTRSVKVENIQNRAAHDMVQHQVEGLSNPLGKSSTGGVHILMIGLGVTSGFKHPLGLGLGATNLGQRLSAGGEGSVEEGGDAEMDAANVFIASGFVGGGVYVAIIFVLIRTLVNKWRDTRSIVILQMLGMLAVSFALWLKGGHYCSTALLWLCIGALDKIESLNPANEKKSERGVVRGFNRFRGRPQISGVPATSTSAN